MQFQSYPTSIPGTYSGLKPGGGGLEDWVWPPGVLENGMLRIPSTTVTLGELTHR